MRKRIRSVRLLAVATAVLIRGILIPSTTNAATYYVAKTGSDTNSCASAQSASAPKLTIKSGIICLKAGDTLYVRAGTYGEPLDSNSFTLPTGTSWADAPRIAAYRGETVILTRGGSARVINLQNPYVQYIVFDGLVIDATGAENGIKIQAGAHHVRFQNCEVKYSAGQGILMTGGTATHHNEILRCRVHGNGADVHFDHGIYIAASDNLVEGCEVHNNLAYGVHVYDGSTTAAHRNVIRRVRSYNNGETGILIGSGAGNLAYNNLVYSNGKNGIQVGNTATENKVYNNTVFANTGDGIQVQNKSSGTLVKNNIVYSNGGDIKNQGVGTTLSNNLTTDPLFADAAKLDFHLQPGSAAIDKGITLSEFQNDYEENPRPAGAGYDIGAHEYTPAARLPSTPTSLRATAQ